MADDILCEDAINLFNKFTKKGYICICMPIYNCLKNL